MSDDRFMLDTSALLTLIEDEAGADRVGEIVRLGAAWIPWVALLEAHYIARQESGPDEADRRYALVKRLPATFVDVLDEPTLLTAGRLKATHRISLADAIIAALAIVHRATLVHKDPEYDAVEGDLAVERLPYKVGTRR